MAEQNSNPGLEYILLVETEHHSTVSIELGDKGQNLRLVRLARDDEKDFRKLMGLEQPKYLDLPPGAKTEIIRVRPDFQVYLDGWKRLSQVAETHYSDRVDIEDVVSMHEHKKPFMYKFWPYDVAVCCFATTLTLVSSALVGESPSDIERIPFYIGGAALLSASVYLAKSGRNYLDAQKNGIKAYENFFERKHQFRESLLRAGVLSGMFPPNYGQR